MFLLKISELFNQWGHYTDTFGVHRGILRRQYMQSNFQHARFTYDLLQLPVVRDDRPQPPDEDLDLILKLDLELQFWNWRSMMANYLHMSSDE